MSINSGHEECPNCGGETAYFNGSCYECPECDYEWDCIDEEDGDDEYDDDETHYYCIKCCEFTSFPDGKCEQCGHELNRSDDDDGEVEYRDFVEND